MLYIGIDGDNIGAKIERHFLENDEKSISFLSDAVQQAVNEISEAIQDKISLYTYFHFT